MNENVKELIENVSFETAKKNLEGVLMDTSLIYSQYFSELTGNEIYIKPENLQKTGSFKIRGAYNTMAKLSKEERDRGVVTSSAGNHAQGVALAAQELGVKSTIVMPETTPLIKVNATKSYGANVVLHGDCYDDAYAKASELEEEHGYTFIHPFDDINVIEGQGTISLEIFEELEDADCIVVPIGGGGLISGVALAAKRINPDIKIIGVEPEEAPCMAKSLEFDEVTTLMSVNTIADGTAVKTPGKLTFDITKEYVDEIIRVSDMEVMEVFLDLIQKHKLVAENSGSLSLAALKHIDMKGKKIVPIISGGNIDILAVAGLIEKGLVTIGRKFKFDVEVPNKPGELSEISQLLADLGSNIIEVKKASRPCQNIFTNVVLEFTVETNGSNHVAEIQDSLKENKYDIRILDL